MTVKSTNRTAPSIKIFIAAHKLYDLPSDELFTPIEVGAKQHQEHFFKTRDDQGTNISEKNPNYCELTALYWIWKNRQDNYVGLEHYRRRFVNLNREKLAQLFETTDIILPKLRKYYIENLHDHYVHTMEAKPLLETRKIIAEKYSAYLPKFDQLQTRTSAHMFNMFIMKKSIFDDYCAWLFDILFELENRLDLSEYDAFQARLFGRISELLLDVYLCTNHLSYVELPIKDVEGVNWLKKGSSFLAAKFFGRKYDKSF